MFEQNYLTYQAAIKEAMGEQVDWNKEEPIPVVEAVWYLVKDSASWQEAYNAGTLKAYYDAYPQEDLWNVVENRACNYNDREYTGTLDGEEVVCAAKWEADNVQSVMIDGTKYYGAIFYDMKPRELSLFNDIALSESAEKTLVIASVAYSGDCQHCWEGTYNAPGAKLPWAVVAPPKSYKGVIEFDYNGEKFYPWGSAQKQFKKGFAVASLPVELGIPSLPAEEAANFNKSDLKIYLT